MASSFIHPFKPNAILEAYFNGPFGQSTFVFFALRRTEHDCEANMSRSEEANVGDRGSPAFLDGEDRADYDRLVAAAKKGVAPRDELEQLWVEGNYPPPHWDVFRAEAAPSAATAHRSTRGVSRPLT